MYRKELRETDQCQNGGRYRVAKIINLNQGKQEAAECLVDIINRIHEGEVISFMFAAKCADGTVATAYGNADFGTRCELVGHVQADIAWGIVKVNADLL
jgi:hypothetical protein